MRRRWLAIGATLLLMLAAGAAAVANQSDDGPILSDYSFTAGQEEEFSYIEGGFVNGLQQDAPHGVRTVVDTGPYSGWDVLLTDQYDWMRHLATDNWITLHLSRPTTVAVVWQADQPVPAWLNEWTYVGDSVVIEDSISSTPRQVYEQEFDAGEVVLGGVYSEGESGDQRSPYVVAIDNNGSEAPPEEDDEGHQDDGDQSDDGHQDDEGHHDDDDQSDDGHQDDEGHHDDEQGQVDDVDAWLFNRHHWNVEPLSVVDTSQLEQPVEGEACPNWVSRRHATQAPDGDYYLTWRPMVDDAYGCHFTYEHGSNPERVAGSYSPPFGYGEPTHIRESEYGYKVHALHAENDVQILATMHFGTAEPAAQICQRFHWNNLQFIQGGELVASIYFMGDFGSAVHNDTGEPLDPNNLHQCENIRTGQVETQAEILNQTFGIRRHPVCTGPETSDCGSFYYPWQVGGGNLSQTLGFHVHGYTINTPNVVAACADFDCLEDRFIGGHGATRFIGWGTGFGVRDPGHSDDGVFYTNAYGDEIVSADTPGAVQQYVRPGTNIQLTHISDNHAYFGDNRHNPGTHGDVTYTQLSMMDDRQHFVGSGHIEVDPQGYIGRYN